MVSRWIQTPFWLATFLASIHLLENSPIAEMAKLSDQPVTDIVSIWGILYYDWPGLLLFLISALWFMHLIAPATRYEVQDTNAEESSRRLNRPDR